MRVSLALVLALALAACGGGSSSNNGGNSGTPAGSVTLATVVSGLSAPTVLEQPNDGSGLFFVVEQAGKIRIVQNGALIATPFLDLTAKVTSGGETGLLGLTFHPNYAQNGKFYVNYTQTIGGGLQTVISEFTRSTATTANAGSERQLLILNQPFSNHNGGQLAFGPDGFLYIGVGDGGSEGDPLGYGQNKNTLFGKILRIDVNNTSIGLQYAIPADNPFASGGGAPEIFAYGLRNPWRFSFDSTGRLFIADVGQDAFEEIDLGSKGANYGWNIMEGNSCYKATSCNQTGLTLPIHSYPHTDGTTVIGGYVYRGTLIPALAGAYVFGDFGNGKIWTLKETAPGTWTRADLLSSGRPISSFGQSTSGEIYVLDYNGNMLQLRPQ